jgi:hypothetical protein
MKAQRIEGIPQGVLPVSLRKFSERRYPIAPKRTPKMRTKAVSEPLNFITRLYARMGLRRPHVAAGGNQAK